MLTDKELEHHSAEIWKLFHSYVKANNIEHTTVGVLVITDYPIVHGVTEHRVITVSPLPAKTTARLLATAAGLELKDANRAG
jgi:hypothetical protein